MFLQMENCCEIYFIEKGIEWKENAKKEEAKLGDII